MKELLEYMDLFFWRMVFFERRSESISSVQCRYLVRMVDLFIVALVDVLSDAQNVFSFNEFLVSAKAEDIEAVEDRSEFRYPVQLIDAFSKHLMNFNFLNRYVDLSVKVRLDDDVVGERDKVLKRMITSLSLIRDYFLACKNPLLGDLDGVVVSDIPAEMLVK